MPEAPVIDWLYGYRKLMTVDAACQIGVFTALEECPRSAAELAEATGSRLVPLTLLLDACVGLDLVSVERDVFANRAVASVYLVEGRPLYLGDLFRVFASESPAWQGLHELIAGPGHTRGPGGWGADPEVGPWQFTRAMHALAMLGEAEALVASVDLTGRSRLVDVGCGSGVYSIALLRRYPGLHATLIDRPEVLQATAGYVSQSGVASRATLEAGDFVGAYPGERDVVLFSDVLYRESEVCRVMIGQAHRALVPGGLLVIRGYFTRSGGGQAPFGPLFDLDRLLTNGAREPLFVSTVMRWAGEAGFRNLKSFPLTERTTCILAEK